MKPTFQISRSSRLDGGSRPSLHQTSTPPFTDWSYQSSSRTLRAAAAPLRKAKGSAFRPGFQSLLQQFEAAQGREFRFEMSLLAMVVAVTAWPIASLVKVALGTV